MVRSFRIKVAYCIKCMHFRILAMTMIEGEANTQRSHVIEEDSPSSVYASGENSEEVRISCLLASLTLAIAFCNRKC